MPRRRVPLANRRFAKTMRQSMAPAEMRLWRRLRKPGIEGCRFRRQTPIGPYIVDFFCPERRLIVEVDGGQHTFDAEHRADMERTRWLEEQGYRVLRVWNGDVFENIEGVCDAILAAAQGRLSD
jgi:very-short-patch-repair endonuclease